jgi:lipoprotein LprG
MPAAMLSPSAIITSPRWSGGASGDVLARFWATAVRKYIGGVPILGPSPGRPATEDAVIAPHRLATRLVAAVTVFTALAGCGGRQYDTDARAVLLEGKRVIDNSPAVHFTVTSSGASGAGTLITGAEGDAHRPDGFRGTLTIMQSGFNVTVHIISAQGYFFVLLPFTTKYEPTDPSKYGFGNPATLLDPNLGLSTLLTSARTATMSSRDRLNGEELYEIDVALPGDRVAALLTSADKTQPVSGRIGVNVDTHQIRRVVLTGPFFDAAKKSTYTLVLDRYGENVQITPPA